MELDKPRQRRRGELTMTGCAEAMELGYRVIGGEFELTMTGCAEAMEPFKTRLSKINELTMTGCAEAMERLA